MNARAYRLQRDTMDKIARARQTGCCPVCGAPSVRWPDGAPSLTCGARKCLEDWIVWGGPAPKKKQAPTPGAHKRAFTAAAYLHRDADPLARGGQGLNAYAAELARDGVQEPLFEDAGEFAYA